MAHPEDAELVEFDDANEAHLAAHRVSPAEVVQVFNADPLWAANVKGRTADWLMIGRTRAGRALVVAVIFDEARSVLRPVTARSCDEREVSKWSV